MQSEFGEDEFHPIPDWLDQSFLESALGNYLDQKVVIESFAVEPATGKGENFASSMFRVKATYSSDKEVKPITFPNFTPYTNEDEHQSAVNILNRTIPRPTL